MCKRIGWVFFTLMLSLSASGGWNTALAQTCTPTLLGHTTGAFNDVFVSGNYAYIAEVNGLAIFNVSNPSNPVLTGQIDMPDAALGVYVSGSRAYVAGGYSGLQIIDVSNPANPTLLGSYNTPDVAWGVYVSGTTAYVADGYGGLQIIDVSGCGDGPAIENCTNGIDDDGNGLVDCDDPDCNGNPVCQPDITVNPLSLDFGSVVAGQNSAPQLVSITNDGETDLLIENIEIVQIIRVS